MAPAPAPSPAPAPAPSPAPAPVVAAVSNEAAVTARIGGMAALGAAAFAVVVALGTYSREYVYKIRIRRFQEIGTIPAIFLAPLARETAGF